MLHRFSLVVLALFLFLVSVVRAEFPACSQPCLGKNLGSCAATDNVCMCKSASYCNSTNTCFRSSCSAADWKAAYDEGVSMCNAAGVTKNTIINPPPPTKREFVPVYYGRAIAA
ncbi:hypothetical protein FRC12_003132 [Ceratobasidium sp. 428]|nr:hypothetical protein FRC12_003132 [Ceratobasidium sp. 428]